MGFRFAWRLFLGIVLLKLFIWAVKLVLKVVFVPINFLIRLPWMILAAVAHIFMALLRLNHVQQHNARVKKIHKKRASLQDATQPRVYTLADGSQHIHRREVVLVGDKAYVRRNIKVYPAPYAQARSMDNIQLAAYYRQLPGRSPAHITA